MSYNHAIESHFISHWVWLHSLPSMLFKSGTTKPKFHITGILWSANQPPADSPREKPAIRKAFSSHGVYMWRDGLCFCSSIPDYVGVSGHNIVDIFSTDVRTQWMQSCDFGQYLYRLSIYITIQYSTATSEHLFTKKRRLTAPGIPSIKLRWFDDWPNGILIPMRGCLLSELRHTSRKLVRM